MILVTLLARDMVRLHTVSYKADNLDTTKDIDRECNDTFINKQHKSCVYPQTEHFDTDIKWEGVGLVVMPVKITSSLPLMKT